MPDYAGKVKVLHFVTGGFSGGATQVALSLVRAAMTSEYTSPLLVLRKKSRGDPARITELQQQGVPLLKAIRQGTTQVKGALFASTVTTVAIFLPVLFMQGVEGQLFYDLALTLAVAVSASMLVALTVIPVASMLWFKQVDSKPDPLLPLWHWLTAKVMLLTGTVKKSAGWVLLFVPGSLLLMLLLFTLSILFGSS